MAKRISKEEMILNYFESEPISAATVVLNLATSVVKKRKKEVEGTRAPATSPKRSTTPRRTAVATPAPEQASNSL